MPAADASAPRPLWRRVIGSAWFHLIAAFIVFGILLSFVAKPYYVPSGSMEETLRSGDRVLVNRLAYVDNQPVNGDIIVFDADSTWGSDGSADDGPVKAMFRWVGAVTGFGPSGPHTMIKRVIAGPGQTVECCSADGRLVVDGKPLSESYVFEDVPYTPNALDCDTNPASLRCLPHVVVPEDSYLVLGDHRSVSSDSAASCRVENQDSTECWRWAKRDDIVGKAVAILWPVPHWRGL